MLGLAIGFGAQSVVEDLLRGIFMLVEDQFGVGDRIDVGTVNGYVERVTLRTTVIRDAGGVPFNLDSLRPTLPLMDYRKHEGRFKILHRQNPEEAERLSKIAERAARLRWDVYEKMAGRSAEEFPAAGDTA